LGQALSAPALVGEPLQTLLFQILESIFLDIENIKILICRSCSTFTRYPFAVFSMKIGANSLALLHSSKIATLRRQKCVVYTVGLQQQNHKIKNETETENSSLHYLPVINRSRDHKYSISTG
jgi:hypothetical protein